MQNSDRSTLPIPDAPRSSPDVLDAKDPAATFPPFEPLRPPGGAPNVLIVLLDDVGVDKFALYGAAVPANTPIIDGLADGRAALLQKVHHTITDGVGGLRLSLSLVDFEPDADLQVGVTLAAGEAGDGACESQRRQGRTT